LIGDAETGQVTRGTLATRPKNLGEKGTKNTVCKRGRGQQGERIGMKLEKDGKRSGTPGWPSTTPGDATQVNKKVTLPA